MLHIPDASGKITALVCPEWFGCLAIWLSDCLAVWLFGSLAVCLSGCLAVRQFGCLAVCLSGCLAFWRSSYLAVWLYGCVKVQLSGCLAVCWSGCLAVLPPSLVRDKWRICRRSRRPEDHAEMNNLFPHLVNCFRKYGYSDVMFFIWEDICRPNSDQIHVLNL